MTLAVTLSARRAAIEDEVQFVDVREFSHNIISLELSLIAKDYGDEEANRAIVDLGLDQLGWTVKE